MTWNLIPCTSDGKESVPPPLPGLSPPGRAQAQGRWVRNVRRARGSVTRAVPGAPWALF